jgi:protein-tyrosine phosphatase
MAILSAIPYWVDTSALARTADGSQPRIGIVPCPTGGRHLATALRGVREQGINTLVSLLGADEVRVLGLQAEEKVCREAGIDYRWFPVDDHSIPESMERFRALVEQLQIDLHAGKGVGAHCFAGIGRSCMLLACLLCLEGLTSEEALATLSAARGLPVPDTWLQSQWVQHFAESLENGREPL